MAAGDLDPTFGIGGKILAETYSGTESEETAEAVVLQPDGKIVAGGNGSGLVRYLSNGALDPTFGHGGRANSWISARDIALQPDGKIVVVGRVYDGAQIQFGITRHNSDGSVDRTFGHDGWASAAFGDSHEFATSVAVMPDGKIFVGGDANSGYLPFALARFNSDGSLDTTFDGDGKLTTSIQTNALEGINDLEVDAQGRLVAFGFSSQLGPGAKFAAIRLGVDGALDPTFDSDGKLAFTFPGAVGGTGFGVRIDGAGKMVFVGIPNATGAAVARLNSDGSPDTSFDGDGFVITPFALGTSDMRDLAIAADGKIIVGGTIRLSSNSQVVVAAVRYQTNGALDTTFDTDGLATTFFGAYISAGVGAVVAAPGGKVILGGFSSSLYDDLTLVRYNAGGSLDTTFDTDGMVFTSLLFNAEIATSVARDAAGNLLLAAKSFRLGKMLPTGAMDVSFGSGGLIQTTVGQVNSATANAIALGPDGKIIMAGWGINTGNDNDFALARFLPSGALDTAFDGDGKVLTDLSVNNDEIYSLLVDPSGKIIAAGQSRPGTYYSFALTRYLPNGALDTSFDLDGKLFTAFGASGDDTARSLVWGPNGTFLAVGDANLSTSGGRSFALARYLPDGGLDPAFGVGGLMSTKFGTSSTDFGYAAVVDANGRTIVVGTTRPGSGQPNRIAAARFNPDGSLDTTFDGDGKLTFAVGAINDSASSVEIDPFGRIVIAGSTSNGRNNDFFVLRLLTDGRPDPLFGTNGFVTTAFGQANDDAYDMLLDAQGRIIVAGTGTMGGNPDFAVARYLSNTPPTITTVDDQRVFRNTAVDALSFAIGDIETPTSALQVSVAADNVSLFPPGSLVLSGAGVNRTLQLTPAANQVGVATVTITVTDAEGGVTTESFVATVALETLHVTSLTATASGVRFTFSETPVADQLNLTDYRNTAGEFVLGLADVQLEGAGGRAIAGSLIPSGDGLEYVFVPTNGVLPTDNYTLTLRSAANGFQTADGKRLDGNADGTPGDDLVTTFQINPAPDTITVGLANFARGPGQPVNLPADSALGWPIEISDAALVAMLTFELRYNPELLSVTDLILPASAAPGSTAALTTIGDGHLRITLHFNFPHASGARVAAYLQASVPESAASRYGESELLDLLALDVREGRGDAIPAVEQDAVHVNAYFGDVGRNGRYDSFDVQQASRNALRLDSGLPSFPLTDPAVLCDFNGNGRIDSFDVQRVSRLALRLPVAEVPEIPSPEPPFAGEEVSGPEPEKSETPAAETKLRSDLDGSGDVDAQDVLWAVYYYNRSARGDLAESELGPKPDVNGDRQFDAADILLAIADLNERRRAAKETASGEAGQGAENE